MDIILGMIFGFVVVCMVLLILLQESKGGGISAIGGAAMDNIVGARNPLRKITVIFSLIFLVLVLALGVTINSHKGDTVPEALAKPEEKTTENNKPGSNINIKPKQKETTALPKNNNSDKLQTQTTKSPIGKKDLLKKIITQKITPKNNNVQGKKTTKNASSKTNNK